MSDKFIDAKRILASGGVGVMPTDTIYGLVASAKDPHAVERVYRLKGRDFDKPCIILIGAVSQLEFFGISVSSYSEPLRKYWPGPVSVVFSSTSERWRYLHRGTNGLAFRLPAKQSLRRFLKISGPLVATSANISDQASAKTLAEARKYFGDLADFYVKGRGTGHPSRVVALTKTGERIIRP